MPEVAAVAEVTQRVILLVGVVLAVEEMVVRVELETLVLLTQVAVEAVVFLEAVLADQVLSSLLTQALNVEPAGLLLLWGVTQSTPLPALVLTQLKEIYAIN
jgi:hypothetical protein